MSGSRLDQNRRTLREFSVAVAVTRFQDIEVVGKSQSRVDDALRKRLRADTSTNPEFWSFRFDAVRRHAHAMFQYPAMMVPQMQARFINDVCTVCPGIRTVYDPFVGSGTVLTETMLHGLDFFGQDVNPLAVLLCRVKAGPFFTNSLADRAAAIRDRVKCDRRRRTEADFSGLSKWFRPDVARDLSKIVRAIRAERELWSRRFFWVCIAETVRLASNSRTSTVKLHIRPKKEVDSRPVDATALFHRIVATNVSNLSSKYDLLDEKNHAVKGQYTGTIRTQLADSANSDSDEGRFDLLITSPPYGDNVTTVTYGQHAYLPLQWIDRHDIDEGFDDSLLDSTHAIDSRSLGGSRKGALEAISEFRERSAAFGKTIDSLKRQPRDRRLRVAAFVRDLDGCLPSILNRMRRNAYMIWVVGNRCVGGKEVRLKDILLEFLETRGAAHVATLQRKIPSKRMALHNGIAATMTNETVLVTRKDAA